MRVMVFALFLFIAAGVAFSKEKKPLIRDAALIDGDEFTPVEELTDEFSSSFDHDKWYDYNPRWKGRQPGLFAANNVRQKRNKLFLKGVYEEDGSSAFDGAPKGYETYTTSFVQSKKNVKFGYFEVKAKVGNSRLSSSFWASLDTPKLWTEIDVFEIGGGAENNGIDFRRRINMNLHVFRDTKRGIEPGKNEISKPTYYIHSSLLRSKYNVYGLDWRKKFITWTFNGRVIRQERNRLWRQAMPLKFDVETFPTWFGLPSKETLPATYKIKYVRTWSRTTKKKSSSNTNRNAVRSAPLSRTGRQIGSMFGLGNSIILPSSNDDIAGGEEADNDGDDGEFSEETEVSLPTEPETDAPQDGLQRPPIPGSNEVVYQPVVPPLGRTWGDMIAQQNLALDDVYGAQIAPGESIDLADFDEETVLFSPTRGGSTDGATNVNPLSEPAAPPASSPASETSETNDKNDNPKTLFGGFVPNFPWST